MCRDSSKCADNSGGRWTSRQWGLDTGMGGYCGWGPLPAAVASSTGRQRPCCTRAIIWLRTFQWLCSHESPLAPLLCPSHPHIYHGCFRLVVFNLSVRQIHLGGWFKHRFLGPTSTVSDWVGPGEGPRLCISDTLPGDADPTGPKTTI